MDFGKLPKNELKSVDFSLPADPALTKKILAGKKEVKHPAIFVGCAKWGRKDWRGLIYPKETTEAQFFEEYVKNFNSIELNAVFYRMPPKAQIDSWLKQARKHRSDFLFCPKFSRSISHMRRLNNAEESTNKFLSAISEFKDMLGPTFLQMRADFGPKNFDRLKKYLEELPVDLKVFVEVRHPEWFSDKTARRDLFQMLYELKKGAVITDASGRRDCVHMELPIREVFIRFVGNGLHPTDFSRIDDWANRLKKWKKSGLKGAYFFLHQHDEKDTPILADYTVKKFNEELDLALAPPHLLTKP